MVKRRNLAEEFKGKDVPEARPQTFASTSLSLGCGRGDHVEEKMCGESLCSETSSSSSTNQFLLTSKGYRQNLHQDQTPFDNHNNSDAGRRYMGGGSREVGGTGFNGGGFGSCSGQGFPSFCFGCKSWGVSYQYPMSA